MKVLTLLLAACASVQAGFLFGSNDEVTLFDEDLDIPGDNPLKHCKEPKDDILTLENVDLAPNPPKAGKTLAITANGTLSEAVEEGAKIALQVKYGLITILKQTADLCETVKKADLECPIEKGDISIQKDVDLPKQIPPGKYNVIADVVTKDDEKITCLTASVTFSRGKDDGDGDDDDKKNYKEDM